MQWPCQRKPGGWGRKTESPVFEAAAKIRIPDTPPREPPGDRLFGLTLGDSVDRLPAKGTWDVSIDGTRHVFDLAAGKYVRYPGRSTMADFDFDWKPMKRRPFNTDLAVGRRFEVFFGSWQQGSRDAADGIQSTPVSSIRPILDGLPVRFD